MGVYPSEIFWLQETETKSHWPKQKEDLLAKEPGNRTTSGCAGFRGLGDAFRTQFLSTQPLCFVLRCFVFSVPEDGPLCGYLPWALQICPLPWSTLLCGMEVHPNERHQQALLALWLPVGSSQWEVMTGNQGSEKMKVDYFSLLGFSCQIRLPKVLAPIRQLPLKATATLLGF